VSPSVAVVGGGISGLAAAHRLRTLLGRDARVTVLERGSRLGGVLRTTTLAGAAYDVGAEAFLVRRPEVPALLAELGLTDELVHPGAAAPAVLAGGRVRPLPTRTLMGVPSTAESLRGVVSASALAQVTGEGSAAWAWTPGADPTVGELVRSRLGPEVVARSVDPLLGGVYSGSADSLGLRAAVPTLAAALDAGAPGLLAGVAVALPVPRPGAPVFGALRGGYEVLLAALAATVEVRLEATVTAVTRTAAGWDVVVDGRAEPFDAVVLAVPAPALAPLLGRTVEVELASVAVVGLAYAEAPELPDTSGLLVATGEALHAKAFTHSSRKWPHLAPDRAASGPVLLRASLGRFGQTEVLERDDDELVALVRADLAAVHGVSAVPVDAVVQRWTDGLPQYGPGHSGVVARLEAAVAERPGLEVAGSLLHGVGVPACIGTGRSAAARVAEHLAARGAHGPPVAP
jgi:oxygen-dependent protoporphyrinogen oxidase